MLEDNNQFVPKGESEVRIQFRFFLISQYNRYLDFFSQILDHLADVMSFGSLESCKKCESKSGRLVYVSHVGYRCQGNVSEFVRCEAVNSDPERTEFVVPSEFKEDHEFL